MLTNPRHSRAALGGTQISRNASGFGFAWTRLTPGLRLPRHAHAHATLNLVLRGEYSESVMGRQLDHGPMTVIGKPAAMEHANSIGRSGATCLVLAIPPERLSALSGTAGLSDGFAAPAGEMAILGLRAIRELRFSDSNSPIILEGIALEMIGLAARWKIAPEPLAPAWLCQVQEAVRASVEAGMPLPRLEELGRMVGRHPVYLARAFRRQCGRSIGVYARELRVERARQELMAGHSLAVVAARAGFADLSHFSRVFRRHTGVSPAEFRRQAR